jgi:Asp-tRNA(Asn)/Glu-tRNA(Gln) amidotransferase B subunit
VEVNGWFQIVDPEAIRIICQEVVNENAKKVMENFRCQATFVEFILVAGQIIQEGQRKGIWKPYLVSIKEGQWSD